MAAAMRTRKMSAMDEIVLRRPAGDDGSAEINGLFLQFYDADRRMMARVCEDCFLAALNRKRFFRPRDKPTLTRSAFAKNWCHEI